MIADIRGGLGTQLLELMGCYALAIEKGETITQIRINCGGESNDGAGNVLKDYVSEMFRTLLAPVVVTRGGQKLGVLKDDSALPLILKHHERVLSALGPLMAAAIIPTIPVLHVRRGDYQWVPLETYIDYARAHDVCLIGNIAEDTVRVPGRNISSGDPVKDWLAGFCAPEIIGTASTFILSMLFFDPKMHVAMFSNQEGEIFEKTMRPLLQKFAPHFPNLRWV